MAQPDNVIGIIGQPVVFNPVSNDSDADADPLQVSQIAGQPIAPGQTITISQGTVTLQPNGEIVFNPADPADREFELTYEVIDPSGYTSTATVSIVVQELDYPHEQDGEDDNTRFEYDPWSLELTLERSGIYNPVFVSPTVRASQQQSDTANLTAVFNIQSPSNDVFAWNHSATLNNSYGSDYMNFAYVRSDDPMARDIADLICAGSNQARGNPGCR